ncbi:MAG: amidohydrolase family protein [Gemmatimonadaceae bacterium]
MRTETFRAAIAFPIVVACAPGANVPAASPTASNDTVEARRIFEGNISAIHQRDRARYLSYYLESDRLARTGPGGLELGFEGWSARRDSTWPDTLVARDLRLVPVAPGIVYGTYHYRVTQGGVTSEGISERVFVRTPEGWRIAVSTAFGLPANAAPPPIAIVGGTLVNPGAAPVSNATVVVAGGRIVCAGPSTSCAPPPTAEVVRADGDFIAPGFIDAHVHYSQTGWVDGRPDAIDLRAEFPYDSVASALRREHARFDRAYLCSGVTSVFDVGGFPWTIPLMHMNERALDAPRVIAAGPLLATIDHWLNTPTMRQFVPMSSDSAVRRAVREMAHFGSRAIKVWYLQLTDSLRPVMRARLQLAGEEARRAGLPLIVHATQLERAKEAVRAGAAVLVHSVAPQAVDDELIALLRERGTIVIPTLTVYEGYADVFAARSPGARYPLDCVDGVTRAKLDRALPEALRAQGLQGLVRSGRADTVFAATARNVRRMHEAGVAIAMGTDAGNPGTAHGPSVYREMEALQSAGIPAADVFASATIVAARAAGRATDLGSLEAGKLGDLVVLEGHPAADIATARRLRLVMKGGALYGRAELLPRR